MHKFLFIW